MPMGVFAISFSLCLFVSAFASSTYYIPVSKSSFHASFFLANLTSFTGEDVCIGDNATYVCSVTGAGLNWDYDGSNAGYSAGLMIAQPLGPFQTEFVSLCNGVLMSRATVNLSVSIANTVNGTTISCDDTSSSTDNFTINIKGKFKWAWY